MSSLSPSSFFAGCIDGSGSAVAPFAFFFAGFFDCSGSAVAVLAGFVRAVAAPSGMLFDFIATIGGLVHCVAAPFGADLVAAFAVAGFLHVFLPDSPTHLAALSARRGAALGAMAIARAPSSKL